MKIKYLPVVVLLLILLPGGCSPRPQVKEPDAEMIQAKLGTEVRKIIKDPGRAETITGLMVQCEVKYNAVTEEIKRLNQELMRVNANYDSTRTDYEQALRKFTEKKNEAIGQYLVVLFDLRRETTPAEWKALLR